MQAVILLAGYGSRLNRDDLPHKSLLSFDGETLLSRHLTSLQELGIERAHLVTGHNGDRVRDYVEGLGLDLPLNFIYNEIYLTTGNTLSVVLGLRQCRGDVLIMDGDVLYPRSAFYEYVRNSPPSSFAVVPVPIDNVEAAKVVLRADGAIHAFITKRALTPEEIDRYRFAGEAIGFFKFSQSDAQTFLALYRENESDYVKTLWEIPFTDLAGRVEFKTWDVTGDGCFEIDTEEDYRHALAHFKSHRQQYG